MQMRLRRFLCIFAFTAAVSSLSAIAQLTDSESPLQYVPLQTPCRAADTRLSGGAIAAGTSRNFNPAGGACTENPTGQIIAYALNVTAIPHGPLGFLTIWAAGELQPVVSTLNSVDGRPKANGAIVAGGEAGGVSVYVSSTSDVILDVSGYFIKQIILPPTYTFFPLPPCRVVDTRVTTSSGFGAPSLVGGQGRPFAFQLSSCNFPTDPQIYGGAFSLNVTAIPKNHKPLKFLTVWATPQGLPNGQSGAPPLTSLLNAPTGTVTANAGIVTVISQTYESVSVYASDDTDVIIDVNGYFSFSQITPGGLSLYTLPPCRVLDTRSAAGAFEGELTIPVSTSSCSIPATAQAYVFNATVLPTLSLGYLTLWPDQTPQPVVSTLNAVDGTITSNMAIVQTTNGSVDAFVTSSTQLILDVSSYFAP